MRLGIFGGSFDPIHFGHLLLAETCREQCQLDSVWFVPASVPPHKQNDQLSSAQQRLEMLELGIAGHSGFRSSTVELDRGGISYTVDTLAAIEREQPGATLFFLMGADSLADLPTWREPSRICQMAIPLVFRRPGEIPPDLELLVPIAKPDRVQEIQRHMVETPLIELSSTEIRDRVRTGKSIRYRTPRAVEKYIISNQLYSQS
jgi:nicotinate-nucleotide adenylyltransferase